MSHTQVAPPASLHPSRIKCLYCGLVSFANDAPVCPRCGAEFGAEFAEPEDDFFAPEPDANAPRRIGYRARALMILAVVSLILAILYVSLIISSEPLGASQKQQVTHAIELLRARGFTREAFMLGNIVSFRSTDNWWNSYTGHADAYAATNFPFQVVTLYPEFFTLPVDDTERAAVLLHEAQHLYGANEPRAFNDTWRARTQLGWTKAAYGETQVYRGVRELTREYAPQIFLCGVSGDRDCTE